MTILRAGAAILLSSVLMYALLVYPAAAEDEDIPWLYPAATPTPLVFSSHGEITEYILGRYPPKTVREIRTRTDGEKGIVEVSITVQGIVCYKLTDCRRRDSVSTAIIEFAWATPTPHANRDALVALYRSTGGPMWKESTNWMSEAPIEQWYGVVTGPCWLSGNFLRCVDGGDGTGVTILDLRENGLVGEIPPDLGKLTDLLVLDLGGNTLGGEIPPDLGKLTDLLVLDLGGNTLSGEIPPKLGKLVNLRKLVLLENKLSGEIPPELQALSNLELLSLRDNGLRGTVPTELGTLTKLTKVRLAVNQLGGCVPANLRRVPDNDFPSLGLPFCSRTPRITPTGR